MACDKESKMNSAKAPMVKWVIFAIIGEILIVLSYAAFRSPIRGMYQDPERFERISCLAIGMLLLLVFCARIIISRYSLGMLMIVILIIAINIGFVVKVIRGENITYDQRWRRTIQNVGH